MKSSKKKSTFVSSKLGVVFLISGILLLAFSYYSTSQILALIGLGLTFWGALFLLITPVRYVEGSLMGNTLVSSYLTLDRIIKDFKYKGKAYHIPPYPEEVYLPDHLKGLKQMVVFIPAEEETNTIPSIEEMAKGKFMLENPKGILLTPPGLNLLNQIEKKSKADFTKTSVTDLCEIMPRYILDNYSLAKEIDMSIKENEVNLSVHDSIYRNLYLREENLKSISLLGCPIASSVACALAKSSGKPVAIHKITSSPDGLIIEALYRIVQG